MTKIGVSSCVLGDKVRFDGGHKCSRFVADKVSELYKLVPICPEVGMGMAVPRPTIHLRQVLKGGKIDIRLVDTKDAAIDHTQAMSKFITQVKSKIVDLDGYIVAAKSPSCGMERIKIYNENGDLLHRKGVGMYVARMKQLFPNLPIEEDGRLNDKGLRESFFTRVTAHQQFRTQVLEQASVSNLIKFHSRNKFLILAYKQDIYRQLGRVVAHASKGDLQTVLSEYLSLMMLALSRTPSRKKHTNVLMHFQGFFKKHLTKEEKHELAENIEFYRMGLMPLLAPLTLLKHHLKKHPNEYLEQQSFFRPFPLELGIQG